MRFHLFAALVVAMMVVGLTACGGGGGSNPAPVVAVDVEFVSGTTSMIFVADVPGDGDIAEFEITYQVSAIGGNVYIDGTCTGGGLALLPEDGNVFEIGGDVLVWTELSVDGSTVGESFLIEEGTTVEFRLTVLAEARGDGFVQLVLEGIGWSPSLGEGDQIVVLPEGEFETMSIFMNYL